MGKRILPVRPEERGAGRSFGCARRAEDYSTLRDSADSVAKAMASVETAVVIYEAAVVTAAVTAFDFQRRDACATSWKRAQVCSASRSGDWPASSTVQRSGSSAASARN